MKYIVIISILLSSLHAAPAYNAKRVFKQADGEEFTARARGNHHLNWIEDENGEILKYNPETNNYEYAVVKDTQLKASGYRYKKQNMKKSISKNKRDVEKIDRKTLNELMEKRRALSPVKLHHHH